MERSEKVKYLGDQGAVEVGAGALGPDEGEEAVGGLLVERVGRVSSSAHGIATSTRHDTTRHKQTTTRTYVQRLAGQAVAPDDEHGHGELGGGVRRGEGELRLGRREEGVGGLCGGGGCGWEA